MVAVMRGSLSLAVQKKIIAHEKSAERDGWLWMNESQLFKAFGRIVLLLASQPFKLPKEALMATLKRIGPGSAFKVGLVVYAFLGLLVGICMAIFSMVAGSLTGMAGADVPAAKMMGFGMGFGAIIIFPILYGIVGGIGGAIGALVYNVVAGIVGGLEVEIN
jgi:hypothetical protein